MSGDRQLRLQLQAQIHVTVLGPPTSYRFVKSCADSLGGVLLLVVCFFISTTYMVERSIVIQAKPAAIHPYINSLQRWPEWSAWNKETYATMVYSYDGPAEGVGAVSRWKEESGDGKMVITQSDPATGIHYDLEFDNGSMKSKGSITLEPVDGGTKVVWKNGGDASLLFKPMLDGMIGPDFEKGLQKMKTMIETAQIKDTLQRHDGRGELITRANPAPQGKAATLTAPRLCEACRFAR